jgi:hypothetical protein
MVQAREIKKFIKLDGSACSLLKQKYKNFFTVFYNFSCQCVTRDHNYKNFYACNLQMFIIS